MSTEENVKLALRFWNEVWNEGNLALLPELFAPDLVEGRHFFISRTLEAFSDSLVTIEEIIANDNKVVIRYSWQAFHTGVWDIELEGIAMNIPPTGKQVWDRGIAIHTIAGGKIVDSRSEWTKLELAQQLGVI